MPKRTASSMSMTVALGTSTPTSITVVDTKTSRSPFRKEVITFSFSLDGICPCSSPRRRSGHTSVRRRSYSSVADFACTRSDSSTSGQTT